MAKAESLNGRSGELGLLREIQQDAVNPGTPLTVLLRKCMILAARLAHEPFKDWVKYELNGYPEGESLPAHRACRQAVLKADLAGPMQAQMRSMDVPYGAIPDGAEWAREVCYRQSVAELEDLASKDSGELRAPIAADVAYRMNWVKGWTTVAVWQQISRSEVVGILDQVRNKVLTFALEIEEENPNAGEAAVGEIPVAPEKVSHIFNTYVIGGNVAGIGTGFVQEVVQVTTVDAGDFGSLGGYLRSLGLEEGDIEDLGRALDEDRPHHERNHELGEKTQGWLGRAAGKVATATGAVGANAGGTLLAAAIVRFLGW